MDPSEQVRVRPWSTQLVTPTTEAESGLRRTARGSPMKPHCTPSWLGSGAVSSIRRSRSTLGTVGCLPATAGRPSLSAVNRRSLSGVRSSKRLHDSSAMSLACRSTATPEWSTAHPRPSYPGSTHCWKGTLPYRRRTSATSPATSLGLSKLPVPHSRRPSPCSQPAPSRSR